VLVADPKAGAFCILEVGTTFGEFGIPKIAGLSLLKRDVTTMKVL
jgi:hypothetical protein